MGTRLVLVRHGESRATVDRIVAGVASCTGLTDHGRRQSAALRDRWLRTGEVDADVVVASAMRRAMETAEIVLPAIRTIVGIELDLVEDCDVCEIHPGECDGMTWDEYDAAMGFDVGAEPDRPLSPGGESLTTFQQRVAGAVDRLVAEHADRTVVVFCHGGFIGEATRWLMYGTQMHEPRQWSMFVQNTAVTEWVRDDGSDLWRLVRLNDFAHLSDVT